MSFYTLLVAFHSWVRWAVLLSAAFAAALAARGWAADRAWGAAESAAARLWVGATDVQLLAGLTLYFELSPVALVARADVSSAWADPSLRFFGALHPLAMLGAFATTHATSIAARRVAADRERFRRLGLGALVALGLLALATPWPVFAYGRPLFRVG